MPTIKYIGVDLSKTELVADLSAEARPRAFSNDASGQAALLAALPAGAHVVCESTGGYQQPLVLVLQKAGVPVSVVMPRRVRFFAEARGLRAKTDPIDARLLSAFGEAMQPRATPGRTAAQAELQELVRARTILIEHLNQEASYAEHCTLPRLQQQAEARCQLLKAQIREIEQRLRTLIAQDPTQTWKAERMQAVCGVGEVTVWTVLAELPELGQLDRGQPAGLLGVAPDPDDSGPRHGHRRIGGGRSAVRKVIYMAALTAAHRNHILAPFYTRLVNTHHKPKLVALTAVMRKLIELLNRLLADPNFVLAH